MSDQIKHTPGPWRLPKKDGEFTGSCVVRQDGYLVADCNIFGLGPKAPSPKVCEANARLIAAAPELLEVCLEMISARISGTPYDQDVASVKMKTAVAKAASAKAEAV